PGDLEEIISGITPPADERVIIPPGDDAGIFMLKKGLALVETVDVITPLVNDPYTFGAISSANSLSDVYAMGGIPHTALAIAGFPSCDYGTEVLKQVLKGAESVLDRAGVQLMGGHCFEDTELKFGLSVTGTVEPDRILRKDGVREGNILIITKPLGTGVLTTALKGGKLKDVDMDEAVGWMLTLNNRASELALQAGAHACTDVTGFGLLGHAFNMVRDTDTDFIFRLQDIPVMHRVQEMIDRGMVAEGAYNNMKYLKDRIEFQDNITEEEMLLLFDPQTSGGLLLSLGEDGFRAFREAGMFARAIGHVVKGSGKIRVKKG
ncbi:MAG TPA: selenide, water dikinase SelD, partial [Nitrospirae bacterium]|nr:selenide, water dikinase SelD [Nitrospirota bacterium]